MMFSDVIAGMSYTPEEIESFSPQTEPKPAKAPKPAETVTRSAPVQMATDEEIEHLKRLLAMLEEQDREEVKATWVKSGIPSITHGLTDDQCDKATQMVIEVLNRLSPEIDAEEVESAQNDHTATDAVNGGALSTGLNVGIGVPKMTQPMIGKVRALLGNREDIHEFVSEKIGRQVTSLKDVTKSEGIRLIDQLISDAESV
jgi:hypothetical protein